MQLGWIGLDVGGTGIKAGLVVAGDVVVERYVPTDRKSDLLICEQLYGLVQDIIQDSQGRYEIVGIGLAVPGAVDSTAGLAVGAANLPWNNTPVCAYLQERTGLSAFLENDTNAAAVGESVFGAGRDVDNFFYMAIGTGIGGGIISEGRLLRGGQAQDAGEIGHIIVDMAGPVCACGQIGCLEALAAAPAIGRMGREAAERAGKGWLWERLQSGGTVDAKAVFEAALAEDEAALDVVARVGRYLAVGLIAVRRLLSPDVVVIGGGVASGGQLLLDAIRQGHRELGAKPVELRLSALRQPGIVGAAAVAMGQIQEEQSLKST